MRDLWDRGKRFFSRHLFTLWAAGLIPLAAFLAFFRLDGAHLFRDEASTACMARMLLKDPHHLPRLFDGRQLVVQAPDGHDLTDDFLPAMQGWLQFYVEAAAFSILPPTTATARLPFVLLGLVTLWVLYLTGRELWGRGWQALLVPTFALGSAFFIVSIRQARYYVLVLLCASWLLREMARYLRQPEIAGRWTFYARLAIPGVLLYFSQYLSFGLMWLSLLVFVLLARDSRLRKGFFLLSLVLGGALSLEFLALHAGFVAGSPVAKATDWKAFAAVAADQAWMLWGRTAPALLVLLMVWRQGLFPAPQERRHRLVIGLCLSVIAVSAGLTLAALREAALVRYYLQVLPAIFLLQTVLVAILADARRWGLAVVATVLMLAWPLASWPFSPAYSEGVVIRQFKGDPSYDAPLLEALEKLVKPGESVAFHRNPIGMTVHFYLPEIRWVGQLDRLNPDNQRFVGRLPDFVFNDYPDVDWWVLWDNQGSAPPPLHARYRLIAEHRGENAVTSFQIYRRLPQR